MTNANNPTASDLRAAKLAAFKAAGLVPMTPNPILTVRGSRGSRGSR